MVPVAVGSLVLVALLPSGTARLRSSVRLLPAVAGVISFLAYVLVLAALQRASAASVAAVRETSVLIVAALAASRLARGLGRSASPAPVSSSAGSRFLCSEPRGAPQDSVTTTVFGSVNASSTELPPTRPTPELEPARPPNGRWLSQ